MPFPDRPYIYEINTRVWLTALSRKYSKTITLSSIPDEDLDWIAERGFNVVWMMGAWQRSPAARRSALNYVHEYRPALPDMSEADVTGSPYAIYDYTIDREMGGRRGMAALRVRLARRNIALMLDFVPNHMATDSPWIAETPGLFVQGSVRDYARDDFGLFQAHDAWGRTVYICRGRDPYFPPWIDTAQLNAFSPALRERVIEVLLDIAEQCDGVRCDMAMLMTHRVFEQTWSHYVGDLPQREYWQAVIPVVRDHYPDFVFTAEVYWDMEYELQQMGFDYTYDKRLYDRILEGDAEKVRLHLLADVNFQHKMVRFLENHDEHRAADKLDGQRQPMAAVAVFTLPGAMLLFDGQLTGSKVKLPVQLGRAPDEPVDEGLLLFYSKLFEELRHPIYEQGEWWLLDLKAGWETQPNTYHLLAHGWQQVARQEYRLIVVNMGAQPTQGTVRLDAWRNLLGSGWLLTDVMAEHTYERQGDNLVHSGLYVELPAYGFQILRFEPIHATVILPEDESDRIDMEIAIGGFEEEISHLLGQEVKATEAHTEAVFAEQRGKKAHKRSSEDGR
ncbi:MAG: alpha-amylase family glycosyl hydrolase [Phototrophicaceae bacterium]